MGMTLIDMQDRLENCFQQWALTRRNSYVRVLEAGESWRFELSVGSWPQCREIRASQAVRILENYTTEFVVSNVKPIKDFSYSHSKSVFEVGTRPTTADAFSFLRKEEGQSSSSLGKRSALEVTPRSNGGPVEPGHRTAPRDPALRQKFSFADTADANPADVKLISDTREGGKVSSFHRKDRSTSCSSSASRGPMKRELTQCQTQGGTVNNQIRKPRHDGAKVSNKARMASRKSVLMLNAGLTAQAALAAAITASKGQR